MESGRPPQPRLSPDDQQKLDVAQGDLRDALGGVRNLLQLLQNVRVGPRAVQAVIPDVYGACARLGDVLLSLIDVIAPKLDDVSACDALRAWISPRLDELERELGAARDKPANARQRLHLERVLARLWPELEAARQLFELLDAAVRSAPIRVGVAELFRDSAGNSGDGGSSIRVELSSPMEGEASLSPRAAIALIGMAARLVAERAGGTPRLSLATQGPEQLALRVTPGGGQQGTLVALPAPPLIAPTLTCALAAARAAGMALDYDADEPAATLAWPS